MRRWFRRWALGLGVTLSAAGPCLAQGTRTYPLCPTPVPVAPGPCLPPSPYAPITPDKAAEPKLPQPQPGAEPSPAPGTSGFTEAPGAGTNVGADVGTDANFAGMFGGPFGSGSGLSIVPVTIRGQLTGPGTITFPNVAFGIPTSKFAILPVTVSAGGLSSSIVSVSQLPGGNLIPASTAATLATPNIPVPSVGAVVGAQPLINTLTGKTLPTTLPGGVTVPPGTPNPVFYAAQAAEQVGRPNAQLVSLQVSQATVAPLPAGPVVFSGQFATQVAIPTFVNIPNPGAGGVVGRQKMSEDANPLPRDRFIFDYDYFGHTFLAPNGQDVNRFVFGVEKTFFDRLASFEMRLAFASTLNSDIAAGGGTQASRVEFGDLRLTQRFLLWNGPLVHVGSGLGMYLPTGNATRVSATDGTPLVRIPNQSITLSPYLGALFTPTDRLFGQAWVVFDFDTNGNPVEINTDGTGLSNVGRIRNATNMQWDGQLGYWVYRNRSSSLLTGVAPFLELHYATTVQNQDLVEAGAFVVGDLRNRVDELNMTAGLTALFGNRSLLQLGVVVPLRWGDDRSFNVQFGVRANFFFGPTPRIPVTAPSTF
jgi:hypothetical protein